MAVFPLVRIYKGSIQINGQEGAGYAISSWHVDDADALTTEDFSLFIEGKDRPDLIVLGVGSVMTHPFARLRMALTGAGSRLKFRQLLPPAGRESLAE